MDKIKTSTSKLPAATPAVAEDLSGSIARLRGMVDRLDANATADTARARLEKKMKELEQEVVALEAKQTAPAVIQAKAKPSHAGHFLKKSAKMDEEYERACTYARQRHRLIVCVHCGQLFFGRRIASVA